MWQLSLFYQTKIGDGRLFIVFENESPVKLLQLASDFCLLNDEKSQTIVTIAMSYLKK